MAAPKRLGNGTAARTARAARLRGQIKRLAKKGPTPIVVEPPAAFVHRRMAELEKLRKSKAKSKARLERSGPSQTSMKLPA